MVNKENKLSFDLEDEVVGRAIITHKEKTLWPNPKPLPKLDAKKTEKKEVEAKKEPSLYETTL